MKKNTKTIKYRGGDIGVDTFISIKNVSHSFLDEGMAFLIVSEFQKNCDTELGDSGERICFPPRGDRERSERQRGEAPMEVSPKEILEGGKKMNGLKPVGLIEEAHGHKGTVMVKPLNGGSAEIMNLKNVTLIDPQNNRTLREVYEVRKYRRGRFLVKFLGLKWRDEIEGYKNYVMAV